MATTNELEFAVFCVESVAESLGLPPEEVFHQLKSSGILDEYIIPSYEVLHTQGKSYITDDIIGCMREKGVAV